MRSLVLIASGILAVRCAVAQTIPPNSTTPYVISTFAGGAPPPTPSVALNASIGAPSGVAADAAGNVYFTSLNCVFKLDTSGTLTRVAGTSRPGYSGDGGPATSAQLWSPSGIALDAAGNLYIADSSNNRVRKVSPTGAACAALGDRFAVFVGRVEYASG